MFRTCDEPAISLGGRARTRESSSVWRPKNGFPHSTHILGAFDAVAASEAA
jgi:hypothetical protein